MSSLLLMKDSIWVKYVANISSVNKGSRITVFRAFVVFLTIASIAPFIYGEVGGLKFHWIRFDVSSLQILFWSIYEINSHSSLSPPI